MVVFSVLKKNPQTHFVVGTDEHFMVVSVAIVLLGGRLSPI